MTVDECETLLEVAGVYLAVDGCTNKRHGSLHWCYKVDL